MENMSKKTCIFAIGNLNLRGLHTDPLEAHWIPGVSRPQVENPIHNIQSPTELQKKWNSRLPYIGKYSMTFQSGHKPGILRDFSEHGKLMEFSENSVQPQGKLTLRSGCSLCPAIHMQPSVSDARKLLIWAMWDNRLLLVAWVVVDVEWPLIYEGHYYVYLLLR